MLKRAKEESVIMEEETSETNSKSLFTFIFVSNGKKYELKLPVDIPYEKSCQELTVRLIKTHKIPFHLEDELHDKLLVFTRTASLEILDEKTESLMYGGSVFEKVNNVRLVFCVLLNTLEFPVPND